MIRNVLGRAGYPVAYSCMSGARLLAACDKLGSGIIICGYHFADMVCLDLYESLPKGFHMLTMAVPENWEYALPPAGMDVIDMPATASDLLAKLSAAEEAFEQRRLKERREKRRAQGQRSEAERQAIADAKALLMNRKRLTEPEAHRYLQRLAMQAGESLFETAAKVKVSFQSA